MSECVHGVPAGGSDRWAHRSEDRLHPQYHRLRAERGHKERLQVGHHTRLSVYLSTYVHLKLSI